MGREDRHLHQRRPDRAPVGAGRRPARRGPQRPGYLPGLRAADGFTDQGGAPLLTWDDPESAFEAWKACSKGRPCDYSGLSYEKLRGGSGIQWPCTDRAPEGTERLYADGRFWSDPEVCEEYGHDLLTGAVNTEADYKMINPAGRAILKAAHHQPPHEEPSEEFPLLLTTGRTVYHFHTRTKTGRARQLADAAPDVWVELSEPDADKLEVAEGDLVRVASPRGHLDARARIGRVRPGVVFAPFHYGYWDQPNGDSPDGRARAANELTITEWDPVSKQPIYKVAAVRVTKLAGPRSDAEATVSGEEG